jgi:hypothetical protein
VTPRAPALLLALALAAIPAAACSAPPRSPMTHVDDASAAEARYRDWHRTTLAPRLSATDRKRADGLLARGPAAERASCRAARDAIAATGAAPILSGSLAALDRDGACWVLRWEGQLGLGLGAVVATDGAVLLAWWIPEG